MKLGDILFICLIFLLLFGPTRLGGLGKGIGEGIRNFKKGLRGSGGAPRDDAGEPRDAPTIASRIVSPPPLPPSTLDPLPASLEPPGPNPAVRGGRGRPLPFASANSRLALLEHSG